MYLGFDLNTNAYQRRDWSWLICKIKKIYQLWLNEWLSRGVPLILVKSVMESVYVYWVSLEYVHISTLDQIRKLSYNFVWKGCKEGFSLHWATWNKITRPNDMDGWCLKYPY